SLFFLSSSRRHTRSKRYWSSDVCSSDLKFINPHHPLSEQTINLTSITDEMVGAADDEAVVIKQFQDFYGDRPLCGHNVQFDVGFVNAALRRAGLKEITQPVVDTLEVSRLLHPEQSRHTLDSLAKKYNVSLEQIGRAHV